MNPFSPQFLFFLETTLLGSVIVMYLTRKNVTVIILYTIQSFIISGSLFYSVLFGTSFLLMVVAIMTFLVKVITAPFFFFRLIKKHRLQFSVNAYLNGPMTSIVLALLIAFLHSNFFRPLATISPANRDTLLPSMSMIFISMFLTVNRKGVLSQMIRILSMENAIVSFAYVSGLETTA